MIKLPYYNDYDISLIPPNSYSYISQQNGYLETGNNSSGSAKIRLPFEVLGKKVYFTVEEHDRLNFCHSFGISCGDFTLEIDYKKQTVKGSYSCGIEEVPSGWNKVTVAIEQGVTGLYVNFNSKGVSFNKVFPDLKIGDFTFYANNDIRLRNIICSESEDYPSFIYSEKIPVDWVENWTLNSANEYVLTNIDNTGIIHLNQETLDKLRNDYDIVGCYLTLSTNKRGENLKSLEFKAGDISQTVEIPQGKSKIVFPLSFPTPSDLDNLTITVRG